MNKNEVEQYWKTFREAFNPRKGGYRDLCAREKFLLQKQAVLYSHCHTKDSTVESRMQMIESELARIRREKLRMERRVP